MSLPHACCTLPPVKSDYAPVGSVVEVNGMQVYSVGPTDAKVALIGFYDIFGFHNNSKQVRAPPYLCSCSGPNGAVQFCDLVARAAHARVLLPDFFRGGAWTEEMFATREYAAQ
jgi:hypothetical protein